METYEILHCDQVTLKYREASANSLNVLQFDECCHFYTHWQPIRKEGKQTIFLRYDILERRKINQRKSLSQFN